MQNRCWNEKKIINIYICPVLSWQSQVWTEKSPFLYAFWLNTQILLEWQSWNLSEPQLRGGRSLGELLGRLNRSHEVLATSKHCIAIPVFGEGRWKSVVLILLFVLYLKILDISQCTYANLVWLSFSWKQASFFMLCSSHPYLDWSITGYPHGYRGRGSWSASSVGALRLLWSKDIGSILYISKTG